MVSKLKLYFAAISGNHWLASRTKLICAGSCLAVKIAMTLNFGLLLFALSAEQQQMSTAMPNALRALRADLVKVLFMLNALLTFHLV